MGRGARALQNKCRAAEKCRASRSFPSDEVPSQKQRKRIRIRRIVGPGIGDQERPRGRGNERRGNERRGNERRGGRPAIAIPNRIIELAMFGAQLTGAGNSLAAAQP
jgi:hypothetical protein